jgi:hypothetical protein
MSPQAQVRAGPSGAEQGKAGLLIRRIESGGVPLIDAALPFEQCRTGEAPALMAERGQLEAGIERRVPYVLVGADGYGPLAAIGRNESYGEAGCCLCKQEMNLVSRFGFRESASVRPG